MAESKNMELNDEMMKKATGGAGEGRPEPKFNIGEFFRAIYFLQHGK